MILVYQASLISIVVGSNRVNSLHQWEPAGWASKIMVLKKFKVTIRVQETKLICYYSMTTASSILISKPMRT